MKYLVDPKYNPKGKIPGPELKLGPSLTLASFLGSPGNRGGIEVFPKDDADRQSLTRQLYLHGEVMRGFKILPGFKENRLEIIESRGPHKENIVSDSITDKKQKGLLVVYEVLGNNGKVDFTKSYDLALFWKDHLVYEEIALWYDRFSSDGSLRMQLLLTLPEISETFETTKGPAYTLRTYYNGRIITDKELWEIL